ncbi:MAG: DeoR/GlpR family DNA-binding transcription regulator [Chloroflexota bacterium]
MNNPIDFEKESKPTKIPLMLDRRTQIVESVRQQGVVRVQELADRFQVSEVTIRSDLAQLEKDGFVVRDRGGAVLNHQNNSILIAFEQRTELHREEKRRIGEAASQFVAEGDTIILDAGTTTVEMVKHLTSLDALTIVTNALNVATEMGNLPHAQVLLLGGAMNYKTFSTLGPLVEQNLNDLMVQKVFLAAESIDNEVGPTDTSMEIAQVKRAMVRAARKVILLADSNKWKRTGFIKVVPFDAIHTIVTDTNLPKEVGQAIERRGIELVLV